MKPFTKRLLEFYARYGTNQRQIMSGIWLGRIENNQVRLDRALSQNNATDVERLLGEMAREPETGTLGGMHRARAVSEQEGRGWLMELAVVMGIVDFPNPEQPFPTNSSLPIELLLSIERELGVELNFPVSGMDGFKLGGKLVPWGLRHYASLFWAAKKYLGWVPLSVLEIGPGLGFLGWLLHSAHLRAQTNYMYTTIDLPINAVIHASILASLIGDESVHLMGEQASDRHKILIVPATDYSEAWKRQYDAVFNLDSFPEIATPIATDYIRLISSTLTNNGAFFSFNHESTQHGQESVLARVKRSSVLHLRQRQIAVTRLGYIQEVYTR